MAKLNPDEWTHIHVSAGQKKQLAWAEGQTFRLPISIFSTPPPHQLFWPDKDWMAHAADAGNARNWRAFTDRKPAASKLPFSYQWIPSFLRDWIASGLGRFQSKRSSQWAEYPAWPVDLSADLLADMCPNNSNPFSKGPTPVLLSHDLDSLEGLQNAVNQFLPIEEKYGAKSTSFIVPCSWPMDHALLREISSRGHKLGIHGYDHSNLTSYVNDAERLSRLKRGKELADQYNMKGYRAPSLIRTRKLLQALSGFYEYDSSIPTSGGLFPVPNNGCASARPFRLEGIAEIPLSMPRDGSLIFLGYKPADILKLWKESALAISKSGGVVVLLTHCEKRFSGNPPMLQVYDEFLHWINTENHFTWCTPAGVLAQAKLESVHAAE